jgi:hypothetical protein
MLVVIHVNSVAGVVIAAVGGALFCVIVKEEVAVQPFDPVIVTV